MERWQDLAHAGVIEYCEEASQGVDGRLDARNDADAAEICGEDQCGEVGNGEGSREVGKGFDQAVKSCIRILGRATPTD